MPFNKGGGLGTMLVMPGRIWTGTMFSGLQEWDPETGSLVRSIPAIEARLFFDIKFDGQLLWILASQDEPNHADSLYVLDPQAGEVVEVIPVGSEGVYSTNPVQLGLSPGKIWVNFGIVDTATLEYTSLPDGLPSEAHFAYDGAGWMWITGGWCHGCSHDLWIINAGDPNQVLDDQHSGVLGTGVLGSPLALAGGKMWLTAAYHAGSEVSEFLDAYSLDQTSKPEIHVDVTKELLGHGNAILAADGRLVWMAVEGTLYYFDNQTGQKLGQLEAGEEIQSLGYDGASLWVLSQDAGLLQIALPWN